MYYAIIVDDEKNIINRLALGFDWKSSGFEVVATSTSSVEAVKMIEFIQPDIVFTDIRMPGLSGIELMKKVHRTNPHIQFVVISGYADFSYAQKAIEVGALAYCLKPLETDEIAEVLCRAKAGLDAKSAMIQSMLNEYLHRPCGETARTFLQSIDGSFLEKGHRAVAVCTGNAAPLLLGNVAFSTVQLCNNCHLHLITSNSGYLDSLSFRSSLINAAAGGQISSFAFCNTMNLEDFFLTAFTHLIDCAYAHFINPADVTLGKVNQQKENKNIEFFSNFNTLAKKNKLVDIIDLLSSTFPQHKKDFTMSEALQIYNGCDALIERLDEVYKAQSFHYSFELAQKYADFDSMYGALMQRLCRHNGCLNTESVKNRSLKSVLEYMNSHFTKPISFQKICEDNCINPSYLSQLFKKELGITFTSYLTQLRMERAKELLLTTTMRITEISDALGYDNYFNFAKLFKKETGYTPKQFRDESLPKAPN